MSWKAVDMQVALPRTQDASQLQEQRSKQHQRFQESLAHTQLKQEVINRKQVNSYERTKGKQNNSKDRHRKRQSKHKHREKESTQQEDSEHPYLGTKIDFSR